MLPSITPCINDTNPLSSTVDQFAKLLLLVVEQTHAQDGNGNGNSTGRASRGRTAEPIGHQDTGWKPGKGCILSSYKTVFALIIYSSLSKVEIQPARCLGRSN